LRQAQDVTELPGEGPVQVVALEAEVSVSAKTFAASSRDFHPADCLEARTMTFARRAGFRAAQVDVGAHGRICIVHHFQDDVAGFGCRAWRWRRGFGNGW